MSNKDVFHEVIELPFFFVDAWIERITRKMQEEEAGGGAPIRFRRRQLSTGSSQIEILVFKMILGRIDLIVFSERKTILSLSTGDPDEKTQHALSRLASYLRVALNQFEEAQHADSELDAAATAIVDELYASLRQKSPPAHEPPQQGASVKAWLDWRDAERQRGRRVSLPRIAEMSQIPIGTLRRHSAKRTEKL